MLSGAGRNRRSNAYTMIATMPTTVISPKVSKPRKSTSMTFTTLRPPACSSALLRKKGASSPLRTACQHRECQRGNPGASDHRDRQIARAACARAKRPAAKLLHLEPLGEPASIPAESGRG